MIRVRVQGQPVLAADRPFTVADAHPLTSQICAACERGFLPSDVVVLVLLGPGSDAQEQANAKRGDWYNGSAIAVHRTCAGV